jgi:hypothetical protein
VPELEPTHYGDPSWIRCSDNKCRAWHKLARGVFAGRISPTWRCGMSTRQGLKAEDKEKQPTRKGALECSNCCKRYE